MESNWQVDNAEWQVDNAEWVAIENINVIKSLHVEVILDCTLDDLTNNLGCRVDKLPSHCTGKKE